MNFPLSLRDVSNSRYVRCVRPLMFEDVGYDEMPYSLGATGFLVKWRERVFFVTARHCLDRRDPTSIRVDLSHGQGKFIPFCLLSQSDEEQGLDIAAFETPLNEYTLHDRGRLMEFSLDDQLTRREALADGVLAFVGYPRPRSGIDYEGRRISRNPLVSDATYLGPGIKNSFHWLSFPTPSPVDSIGGMSGSPVLQFRIDQGEPVCVLAGMVINGTVISGKVQIVSAIAIIDTLERMVRSNDSTLRIPIAIH